MNKRLYAFGIFATLTFTACGQTLTNQNLEIENQNMDLSNITNSRVKQAIEALQANDKSAWFNYFTKDAVFTDDGSTLDIKSFFDNAFNHKEKFLTIDKVENEGKDITGDFFAGQWGIFKVFFKFHLNTEGKINRLDIGQAN